MPAAIERPEFQEGQILSPDDLNSLLRYMRDQEARHARHAHSWGIAHGLGATLVDGEIRVDPGLAIDSSGAARIILAPRFLAPKDFLDDVPVPAGETQFPLFLVGREPLTKTAGSAIARGSANGVRKQEVADLNFRRATSLVDWDTRQDPPDLDKGPDDKALTDRPILLGVVTWDNEKGNFKDFAADAARVGKVIYRRRHLGVRADAIESIGGRMFLRTAPAGTRGAPLVRLDPAADSPFVFGVDDGGGEVSALLSVDLKGDLVASGKLSGTPDAKKGEVHVQSGQIFDGLRVPLPPTITDDMVQSGAVTIHVMLTPRLDASARPDNPENYLLQVLECAVDDDRVVRCQSLWLNIELSNAGEKRQLPGVCDYLILAKATS